GSAGRPDRPLRTDDAGGGVPGHRPFRRPGEGRRMTGARKGRPEGGSLRRIGAMILRYWYLLRGSWPRLLELAYWPTMQMIVWGLVTVHLMRDSNWIAQAGG